MTAAGGRGVLAAAPRAAGPGAAWFVVACFAVAGLCLAACSSAPPRQAARTAEARVETRGDHDAHKTAAGRRRSPYAPAQEDPSKRGNYTRGGLYAPGVSDSAPSDGIADIDEIPEPEVRDEPRSRYGNRSPYTVLDKTYRVLDSAEGYDETGIASFYGNKFHGRRTSNLEVYDMYAFTAAHKTLPLPSFARVTNLANGKSVVVRINDRGPFHEGRIIDLSYAAAVKLGVDRMGTARVEVQGLVPGEDAHVDYGAVAAAAPAATAPAATNPVVSEPLPDVTPLPQPPPAATAIDRLVAVLPTQGPSAAPPMAPAPLPAALAPVPLPASNAATPPAGITLQVGTFADPANAQRALATLNGAGVAGARVEDGTSGGREVWRVRIGPLAPDAAEELAARLRGLGFGQPQRVHE